MSNWNHRDYVFLPIFDVTKSLENCYLLSAALSLTTEFCNDIGYCRKTKYRKDYEEEIEQTCRENSKNKQLYDSFKIAAWWKNLSFVKVFAGSEACFILNHFLLVVILREVRLQGQADIFEIGISEIAAIKHWQVIPYFLRNGMATDFKREAINTVLLLSLSFRILFHQRIFNLAVESDPMTPKELLKELM